MKLSIGQIPIQGPEPFRVEFPFGLPGDGFRKLCRKGKATCVAYHKGVDPSLLSEIGRGNEYRYGPGDEEYEALKSSMLAHGFIGGNGGRILIFVNDDRAWIAEGNHRLRVANEIGIPEVEVEIRYLNNADETFHLIPFDPSSPAIKVISE